MNHLVVCGLNYHSSPIAIRERFTIPESCLQHALHALARMPHIKEAVVLSTCNRTEVYANVSDVRAGLQEIESFFISTQSIADHQVLRPNFKLLREDAVLHLFRVASGLDSMVLGEGQIMSQVKAAHQAALEAGTAGSLLDQIFKLALTCGKRVRSETSMSRRAVSISSASVELAKTVIGPLRDRNVVVIGAGRMAQICVKHLLNESGKGSVVLVNRSRERIDTFLQNNLPNRKRLATSFEFEDRHQLAVAADLVIVATSAHEFVLDIEQFTGNTRALQESAEKAPAKCPFSALFGGKQSSQPAAPSPEQQLPRSIGKNVTIIDISVPRNVDPQIGTIDGVKLFNTDDLSAVVNKNLSEREALVEEAEKLIFETLDSFHAWQRSLLVVPTITGLRNKIEAIRMAQMEKTQNLSAASGTEESKEHLEEISRAIVNQILHHPTIQLKATRDYEILKQQAEALRLLFNLDPLAPAPDKVRVHQADPQLAAHLQSYSLQNNRLTPTRCLSPATPGRDS